jgi:phenol 2-monooxygenase
VTFAHRSAGVHGAVNLAWKLGGVLNGRYKPDVLHAYSPERCAVTQQLIKLDKTISTLISRHIPDSYTSNARGGDVSSILLDVVESSSEFTIGLGVLYEPDGFFKQVILRSSIRAGRRVPDVLVRKPGSHLPTRLYELTKNKGKFWVVVFAGEPLQTAGSLQNLRAYLDSTGSFFKRLKKVFDFLTNVAGPGLQPVETLGVDKFGRAYYDIDHTAFAGDGISPAEGGVVVFRPDGVLAVAARLNQGEEVGKYFDAFVMPQMENGSQPAVVNATNGSYTVL